MTFIIKIIKNTVEKCHGGVTQSPLHLSRRGLVKAVPARQHFRAFLGHCTLRSRAFMKALFTEKETFNRTGERLAMFSFLQEGQLEHQNVSALHWHHLNLFLLHHVHIMQCNPVFSVCAFPMVAHQSCPMMDWKHARDKCVLILTFLLGWDSLCRHRRLCFSKDVRMSSLIQLS